jgi:SAM-dependent methyltransferase
VSEDDRRRWDERHAEAIASGGPEVGTAFVDAVAEFLPGSGRVLDVACGRGGAAVALATRGLEVWAVDVSLVALAEVRRRAEGAGVGRRVHTLVCDLDSGLPPELPHFDVVLCQHFHAPALWPALRAALAPGGVLAVETLTTRNAELGLPSPSPRFLVAPGEILGAAAGLEVRLHVEDVIDGAHRARLVARAPSPTP